MCRPTFDVYTVPNAALYHTVVGESMDYAHMGYNLRSTSRYLVFRIE